MRLIIRICFGVSLLRSLSLPCVLVARPVAAGPDFTITIADRGRPVSGVRVAIGYTMTVTDQTGKARFHHIAPGSYTPTVGADPWAAVEIQVAATGPLAVDIPLQWPVVPAVETRALAGTLHLANDPADQAPRSFQLEVLDGRSGEVLHTGRSIAGEYRFPDLPDGVYFLEVFGVPSFLGPSDGSIPISIAKNSVRNELDLELAGSSCGVLFTDLGACSAAEPTVRSLRGKVLDATQAPVKSAEVLLSTTEPQSRAVTSIKTDASGAFAISNAPPGFYRLSITSPGFASLRTTVRLDSTAEDHALRIQLGVMGLCSSAVSE